MSNSNTQPTPEWKKGDAITAERLNRTQLRALTDIRVGPGLRLVRNGNGVSIMLATLPTSHGAAAAGDIGVREGTVHLMVADSADGWAEVEAINPA